MSGGIRFTRRGVLGAGAGMAAMAVSGGARAQAWPTRALTIIVPFPAGGTSDITARLVGIEIAPALGQSIVVENRPGANGNVGSAQVARAAPDGYTLLLAGVGSNAVNHGIYKNMPYNSNTDFAHITQLTAGPNVLLVNKNVPARDLKELIAWVKANAGKLNYASAGNGASGHMAMELLKLNAGLDIQHVPYRGGAPALNDVISGQIPMMFTNQDLAFAQAAAGTVRLIGVASLERNAAEPSVPTVAEQGFPGFEAMSWNALAAPAGTPRAIIDRLHGEIKKALQSPSIQDKLVKNGFVIGGNTPEEQSKFVAAEIVKWAEVARVAKVSVE